MAEEKSEKVEAVEEASAEESKPVVKKSTKKKAAKKAAPKPAPKVEKPKEVVLRMNIGGTFEHNGKRWTASHPFQICTPEEAEFLMEQYDWMHVASPEQIKNYYG